MFDSGMVYIAKMCIQLNAILGALCAWSQLYVGYRGLYLKKCISPSSLNSSKAQAGNRVLAFCFASVLFFIREEQNRHRIIIGKL